MRSDVTRRIAIGVVFVAALSAYTTLLATFSPRIPTAASLLGLAVAVTLLAVPGAKCLPGWLAPERRRDLGVALAGGALMFFVAPLMVLSNHYSDAPPGSQVVFTTTACWGALVALAWAVGLLRRGERRAAAVTLCGMLASVVGSAIVVADWERPSSFSPFVRYPIEDAWMIGAGVVFAVGLWLLARTAAKARTGGVLLPAALGALVLATAVTFTAGGPLAAAAALATGGGPAVAFALSGAVAWVACIELARDPGHAGGVASTGWPVVAVGLFLPAVALSLLARLEPLLGTAGPDPLLWAPVAAGSLLVLAGAWSVLAARTASFVDRPIPRRASIASVAPASIALVGIALPALRATLSWNPGDGRSLDIAWKLAGVETAPGWWALAVSALLVAAVLTSGGRSRLPVLAIALLAMACVPAYVAVRSVPLHTWTAWLSPEVQQDYGTPYASLVFAAVADRPLDAAVALSGIGIAIVSVYDVIAGSRGLPGRRPESESGEMIR